VSLLHDAMTALLSGITTYKAGTKEILWQDKYNTDITIEVVDVKTESYIERKYYNNGQLHYKDNYQNGKQHGLCKEWHDNEQLYYEGNYQNGKQHGLCKAWLDNGQLYYEENYRNGVKQ